MTQLETLFMSLVTSPEVSQLILLDKNGNTTGILYTHYIKPEWLVVTEQHYQVDNDEKYFMDYQGLVVFFSSWKKVTSSK